MKYSIQLKYIAVSLALIGIAAGDMPESAACSCVPPPPPLKMLEKADAVFEGTVQMGGKAPQGGGLSISTVMAPITFNVLRAWKGAEAGKSTIVMTSGSTASCGFPFAAAETYLVYAFRDTKTGELATGLCSRTRKSAEAAEDFAALGPPGGQPDKPSKELPPQSIESTPDETPKDNNTTPSSSNTEEPEANTPAPIHVAPAGTPEGGGGCASCSLAAPIPKARPSIYLYLIGLLFAGARRKARDSRP